ncbi:DUF1949 domain-containing protein [Vibrio lentus]|nr:DUF1949 domain-containing protein [Vibrio lentus]
MAQHQAVEVQADYGTKLELIIEIESLQVDSFTQTMINKKRAKALVTKVKRQLGSVEAFRFVQ